MFSLVSLQNTGSKLLSFANMDSSVDEDEYEKIEGWCQTEISRGAEWFFDPTLFRSTLREKSKQWNVRYEVCFVAHAFVLRGVGGSFTHLTDVHSPSSSIVPSLVASKPASVSCQSHGPKRSKERYFLHYAVRVWTVDTGDFETGELSSLLDESIYSRAGGSSAGREKGLDPRHARSNWGAWTY